MITVQGLSDHAFFRGLTGDQATAILNTAAEKSFEGGDVLVRQFDKNTDMMIVTEGKVVIKSFSGETVAELGQGSVVGEISLVDDSPRSMTVTSVGPSKVVVIPSSALRDLMDGDLHLKAMMMENLARLLCGRLRAANINLDGARS